MTTEEGPQEGVGARTQPALTRQDFADLTRHLRTVHFSLFLACAVLWISAAVTSRTGAAAAREQFQHIMRMHSDWEQWTVRYAKEQKDWLIANEPFFTDQFQNALRRTLYADVAELSDAGVNTTHSWSIGLRRAPIEVITSFRTIDSEEELILARYIGPGFASGSKSLVTTLNGFRGFWDGADRVIVIVQSIPSPEMYVLSEGEIQRNLPGGAQPGFRLQSKLRLEQHIVGDLPSLSLAENSCGNTDLYPAGLRPIDGPQGNGGFACGTMSASSLLFVLPTRVLNTSPKKQLRIWLAEQYHFKSTGEDFSKIFVELNEFTKKYQHLNLDDVDLLLSSDFEREAERIDFIGLRFPRYALSFYGPVAVIILQLYVLLHLRRLVKVTRTDSDESIAWIALYEDRLSRLISLLTLSLAPFAVVVRLLWGERWQAGEILLLLFGGCLAAWTARLLWRLSISTLDSTLGNQNDPGLTTKVSTPELP